MVSKVQRTVYIAPFPAWKELQLLSEIMTDCKSNAVINVQAAAGCCRPGVVCNLHDISVVQEAGLVYAPDLHRVQSEQAYNC